MSILMLAVALSAPTVAVLVAMAIALFLFSICWMDGIGSMRERTMARDRKHFYDFFDKIPIIPADEVQASALTDNSGGVSGTVIAAITQAANVGSADLAPTANAIASLATQVNNLRLSLLSRNDYNSAWQVLGVNATSAQVTRYARGGILLATAGAPNDTTIIAPYPTRRLVQGFRTSRLPRYEWYIQTQASIADMTLVMGFAFNPVTANTYTQFGFGTNADEATVIYQSGVNSGAFRAGLNGAGTGLPVVRSLGITVEALQTYRVVMTMDASRRPRFLVSVGGGDLRLVGSNDGSVGNWPAMDANTVLRPWLGIRQDGAAAVQVAVLEMDVAEFSPGPEVAP